MLARHESSRDRDAKDLDTQILALAWRSTLRKPEFHHLSRCDPCLMPIYPAEMAAFSAPRLQLAFGIKTIGSLPNGEYSGNASELDA